MPRLHPFAATRYTAAAGEPGRLLAPPYDVISDREAATLREADPHNAVHLVLPEGTPPGCYQLAAARLRAWLHEGVLVPDPEPSVYLYEQTFRPGGGAGEPVTRTAIVAALQASPFSAGQVLPHEETHAGPREDRLALMRACRAQLSPVFLIARDPSGEVERALERARSDAAPDALLRAPTADGTLHVLRRVPGAAAGPLLEAAAARPLLVADGHHRYETALAYGAEPSAPDSASRVLACVVGERDPGLSILPTHRALHGPPAPAAGWPEILERTFRLEAVDNRGEAEPAPALPAAPDEMVVATAGGAWRLRPRAEVTAAAGLPNAPAVLLFDRLVLREALGTGHEKAVNAGVLSYHRDAGETRRAAGARGAAFFLPPLDPARVWELAHGGVRLPPKSTYFWPKMPSGLVFRLLNGEPDVR